MTDLPQGHSLPENQSAPDAQSTPDAQSVPEPQSVPATANQPAAVPGPAPSYAAAAPSAATTVVAPGAPAGPPPPGAIGGTLPGGAGMPPPGWNPALGGRPPTGVAPGMAPTNSALAVASLVLAILWGLGAFSVLAVLLAIVAYIRIHRARGRLKGRGIATVGLIVGLLGIAGGVVVVAAGVLFDHALRGVFSPKTLALGQSANYNGTLEHYAVTNATVYGFQTNVGTPGSVPPSAGMQYDVADVQVCAGQTGFNVAEAEAAWNLELADGTTPAPVPVGGASPDLVHHNISANTCSRGLVTFEVSQSATVRYVEFQLATHPYQWTVPTP